MKIFLTGATGFIGTRLVSALVERGHEVHALVRPGEEDAPLPENVEVAVGDPMESGAWWEPVSDCDGAVNLAGYPVFSRWTPEVKLLLRESRLATTRNLVSSIPRDRGFRLLSASGMGIFGDAGEQDLDEKSLVGNDFLASLARDWEEEALPARERGARVALLRFGIVLGPDGGALPEMVRNIRRFLTGPLGTGRQWMPWIHREDVVRAILFLLENRELEGPFNLCAPNPQRQRDVARTIGRLIHRPAVVPAPAFALQLALGECAKVALFSQKGVPKKLLEAGFTFQYPELEPALAQILPHLDQESG